MIQSKVKIQCAHRACKNARFDCKNRKSFEASPNDVALNMCRPVRKDCEILRFCCKEHQRRCQPIDSEKRGPREGMTPPQVALLVDTLLKSSAPWAVPLLLMQITTGERCGCMTRARVRWLDLVSCRLTIEKVTGKTQERSIALTPWLRVLIEHWLLERPLVGADRGDGAPTQWPFPDQPMDEDACLFPGQEQGQGRYRGRVDVGTHPSPHEGTLKESGKQVR